MPVKFILRQHNLVLLIKYCMVGVSNGAVFSVVSYGLSMLGLHYIVYSTIGYIIAFFNSYYWNKRFTFKGGKGIDRRQMTVFFGVNFVNLMCAQVVQIISIETYHTSELVGIALGAVFYTLCGFVMNKYLVFKHKK